MERTEMVFCKGGGFLVGGKGWLPTAPWDHYWGNRAPVAGCNRLCCERCGWQVRDLPGFSRRPGGDFDLRAFVDADLAAQASALTVSPAGRIYACDCESFVTFGDQPLRTDILIQDVAPRHWQCGGHPEESPRVLEGVDLGSLQEAVGAALAGEAPDPWPWSSVRREKWPGLWLARVYVLKPALRESLGRAVACALSGADPVRLRTALDFYFQHPHAPGAEGLATIVGDERDRFRVAPDPFEPRRTLDFALMRAFEKRLAETDGERAPIDVEVRKVARSLLLGGERRLVHFLGRLEPEWLAARADDVVRAGVDADWVLSALKTDLKAARQAVERLRSSLGDAATEAAIGEVFPGTLGDRVTGGQGGEGS